MTKDEIALMISRRFGLTKVVSREIYTFIAKEVAQDLAHDRCVGIPGVGTIFLKEYGPRKARNPRNGESIDIPARERIRFRPAKALKDCI